MAKKSATAVKKTIKKKAAKKPAVKSMTASRKITISEAELRALIEKKAFELFLNRGCSHGDDAGDWFKAEQELRSKCKQKN